MLLLTCSVAMGLTATWLATAWLKRQGSGPGVQVLVATRDLPAGAKLERGLMEVRTLPSQHPLTGPIVGLELAEGRTLNRPILKGEPILEAKLWAAGEKGGLAATLAPGRRAVTVKVNEIIGVAGFALPGTYVDLMVNLQDGPGGALSKIVVERLAVLAVAQDRVVDDTKPRVVNAVTLEVSPQQAEQIDLARNIGTLSLVLRGQLDTHSVATSGVRQADLFLAPATPTGKPVSKPPGSRQGPGVLKGASNPPAPSVEKTPAPEVIRGLRRSLD